MRWGRGFFRLWIVASIVFAVAVLLYGWSGYNSRVRTWERLAMVPVKCSEVRGAPGVDFGLEPVGPGPWDARAIFDPDRAEPCWQHLGKFREDHPELEHISSMDVMRPRYQALAPDQHLYEGPAPWMDMIFSAVFAVVVPSILLAIGWVIGWIISGFRREA